MKREKVTISSKLFLNNRKIFECESLMSFLSFSLNQRFGELDPGER